MKERESVTSQLEGHSSISQPFVSRPKTALLIAAHRPLYNDWALSLDTHRQARTDSTQSLYGGMWEN